MAGPSVQCKTLEEALGVLRKHEAENRYRYSTIKATKGFGNIAIQNARKVFWEDKKSIIYGRQNFTGVPFVILGQKDFDCQFGKERKKKAAKDVQVSDHDTYTKGKRFLLQPTKKRNCPAKCVIREICTFPSYKVENIPTKDVKNQINMDIICRCRSAIEVPYERMFILCLPLAKDHTCDPVGECPTQPVDPRVSQQIKELRSKGVRTVGDMKRHLKTYISSICQPLPHPTNRRFYPTDKSLQNIMYSAQNYKIEKDQQSLQTMKTFIFIHQTKEQRRLLNLYGCMVLLDATYKTTLFDLPLFFISVKTNVDYQIVGTFMVERETAECIKEALQILKEQNKHWKPSYFMTDFDESEIKAI